MAVIWAHVALFALHHAWVSCAVDTAIPHTHTHLLCVCFVLCFIGVHCLLSWTCQTWRNKLRISSCALVQKKQTEELGARRTQRACWRRSRSSHSACCIGWLPSSRTDAFSNRRQTSSTHLHLKLFFLGQRDCPGELNVECRAWVDFLTAETKGVS